MDSGELSVSEQQQISDWCDAVNSTASHQQDLIGSDLGVARTLAPGTHASGPHLTKTLITSNAYGVVTKGNGDAFINEDTATALSTGGGQAGQGYPCVLEDKSETGCLNGWDVQSKRVFDTDGVCATLNSGTTEGKNIAPSVLQDKCLNPWDVQSKHIQPEDGIAESLYAAECRYGGGESYVMTTSPTSYQDTTGALCAAGYSKLGVQEAANDMYVVQPIQDDTEILALDRASFSQGKNAKYDFSIQKDVAQTLVARGPGGVMVSDNTPQYEHQDTVGAICASDYKGIRNQDIDEQKYVIDHISE